MINLLPREDKRQLAASRANTMLLRYNFFLLGALAFLGLAIGATYLYLTSSQANAEERIRKNKAEAVTYAATEEQAREFRANLAIAKQILDKEVIYTKAMLAIAQLLPDGVIIETLNLDSSTFGTPITLNFQAKNVEAAVKLKESFENSNLLTNVNFQSIGTEVSPDNEEYPVAISMNITINKGAAE